jgi:antitoxin YefM
MYRIMYTDAMPKSVPFTEARARLSDLLDQVERSHEHVEITRNGRPAAVLMSPEEYESIVETLEILGDDELLGALEQSEEDVKSGRLRSWEDIKRDLGVG